MNKYRESRLRCVRVTSFIYKMWPYTAVQGKMKSIFRIKKMLHDKHLFAYIQGKTKHHCFGNWQFVCSCGSVCMYIYTHGEVVAYWLESRTRNPKVVSSSLRSGRNCRWGEWMYSALSSFNTTTEVPLSKAPNPQLLPGRRSINGCPLLRVCVHGVCVFTVCVCSRCVCVHFGWVKCRAQIPSMGHHTWPYVTRFFFPPTSLSAFLRKNLDYFVVFFFFKRYVLKLLTKFEVLQRSSNFSLQPWWL